MLEHRATKEPEHISDVGLTEHLDQLAAKLGGSLVGTEEWWKNAQHAIWPWARRWFPGLSDEMVERDPLTADQAVRELRLCKKCREGEPDGRGGVCGCNLAERYWRMDPLYPGGSNKAYLVLLPLHYADGEKPRHEWAKRECRSKFLRAQEIAQLEGREVNIGGGMRGTWEVER